MLQYKKRLFVGWLFLAEKAQIKQPAKANYQQAIIKLIRQAASNIAVYQVFNDFLEMAAISISNQVDFTHQEEREKRYLSLINSYDKTQHALFSEMLADLVEAMEEKVQMSGPEDVLGPLFHALELHNKYKGQFFTPQPVADMMAAIAIGDKVSAIEEKGYITACEPACGSGVLAISLCKAMGQAGYNYCTQVCLTAEDIDAKCVHMTYLQLALYGVPAVVIHGNSLTGQEWSRWYTPVYILNGWGARLNRNFSTAPVRFEPKSLPQITDVLPETAVAADSVKAEQGQIALNLDLIDTPFKQKSGIKRRRPAVTDGNTEQLSLF